MSTRLFRRPGSFRPRCPWQTDSPPLPLPCRGAGRGSEGITVAAHDDSGLAAWLEERIIGFNYDATSCRDGMGLIAQARAGTGELLGALSGHTWAGTAEIAHLWVAADCRGQGLGSALLAAAEAEARRRGCRQVTLATHTFQAPAFYERHGYRLAGEVPDYPPGHAKRFYVKAL